MMTKDAATARLSREIRAAEAAYDTAMEFLSSAMTTSVVARRDGSLGPATGQAALMRMNRSMEMLLKGKSDLARAHDELLKVGVELGVFEEPTCPEEEIFTGAEKKGDAVALGLV